ncbi:MAG: (Fe-S)-binding protein, partial [Kiritimatiellae bacterium]|nr:(Fe-S)-binding protein [Kiritimatiellia bacterium]
KADVITDAWRVLECIRRLVNETWLRRDAITPLYERRSRPPALEVYKRLPGINCRKCGEKTCLAFACRLWRGEGVPSECRPIFEDPVHARLQEPYLQICAGLGLTAGAAATA